MTMAKKNDTKVLRPGCNCGPTCSCGAGCACGN
jgi:hypothetical protein